MLAAKIFVKIYMIVFFCSKIVVMFNVDTESTRVFKGPKNSYFGYSVAILSNSQGTWLLAGAPRANDSSLPDVLEPGAVFQCNWQYKSSCQPLSIDNVGNEKQTLSKWKNTTVHHLKNNQWLGTTIDVNTQGDFRVIICAPRWINQKYSVQGNNFMNGICYESGKDLQFDNSSARPILEHYKKQINAGRYHYGMGSLGMSAVYSKDGSYVVIGAPGINDWAGGYAKFDWQYPTKPQVLEMPHESDFDSYFGMTVTTAKLSLEEVYTVIGGPRAKGYGKIHAYNSNSKLILVKEGDQLGSSFGSSLCAADVNGDNLDDLFVGAPLYSDKLDEGRVYVYLNREFFNLELVNLLAGSNTVGSRFGTAVACMGDLNLDSFDDIAVGAPYEDESGVVYIYNGAKNGLYFEPSQRIVGKSIGNDLKTFGWSFSRPWDVDSNHYKDFAVGAFESSKVILFRTRSVLELNASLEISTPTIDNKNKMNCVHQGHSYRCIEVTICLQYYGKNLPTSSDVNVTLKLDTLERHRGERSRMFIQGPGFAEVETLNDIITVRLDKRSCPKKYIIYTRESRDVFTPLKLELDYDIASSSIGIASSCLEEMCPIRNIYSPTTTFALAYYALECKGSHQCQPNFIMTAHPVFKRNDIKLVIDESPYFDLETNLTNQGEISYLTMVTISYPVYLQYTSTVVKSGGFTISCFSAQNIADSSENIVNCDILNHVKSNDQIVLISRFYVHNVPYDRNSFMLNISTITVNQRIGQTMSQKYINVTIPFHIASEMKLTGSSMPGQLQIPKTVQSVELWESVSHVYTLSNFGPSSLPHSQLLFQIPTKKWLKLNNAKVESKSNDLTSHIPVECTMSEQTSETSVYQSQGSENSLTSLLKCEPGTCTNVTCYVGNMNRYQSVHVNISLSIRRDVLQTAKIDDQLVIVSSCQLQEPTYISYTSLTTVFNTTANTYILYKTPVGQPISWWALIISIVSGVLLLYIMIVLLWKCGFFKRKQKEELLKLIQYFEFERELHSDSGSARSSDLMVLPAGLVSPDSNHHCLDHPESPLSDPSSTFNFGDNYLISQSLNRRQNTAELPITFHTLQFHNNNKPLLTRPRNHHRTRDRSHNSNRKLAQIHNVNFRPNLWLAPTATTQTPPPSFNNDLYLEPLESRA